MKITKTTLHMEVARSRDFQSVRHSLEITVESDGDEVVNPKAVEAKYGPALHRLLLESTEKALGEVLYGIE